MQKRLLEIFSRKPELINRFPSWMLSGERIRSLRRAEALAIAEIAGRDSVAAVLKAAESGRIKTILPTVAYTGTEFGDWSQPFEKAAFLREVLRGRGLQVHEPVVLGSPELWWILCGRYASKHVKEFGFYTPCLGCHLYFHAIRIPLSKMVDCTIVIGGERESHDGRIKLNQIGIALDAYTDLLGRFGVELLLPLRSIRSGEAVQRIIGSEWSEGSQQLLCVMRKNYLDERGEVEYSEEAVRRYFDRFALSTAEAMVQSYVRDLGHG